MPALAGRGDFPAPLVKWAEPYNINVLCWGRYGDERPCSEIQEPAVQAARRPLNPVRPLYANSGVRRAPAHGALGRAGSKGGIALFCRAPVLGCPVSVHRMAPSCRSPNELGLSELHMGLRGLESRVLTPTSDLCSSHSTETTGRRPESPDRPRGRNKDPQPACR